MDSLDCNRNRLETAAWTEEEISMNQENLIEVFKATVFLEPYDQSDRLNQWLISHSIDPYPVLNDFRKFQSSFFGEIAGFMAAQKLFPFARYFARKIEDGYQAAGCLNEVVFLEKKSEREFRNYLRSTGALLEEEKNRTKEEKSKEDAFHFLLELEKDQKDLFLMLGYRDLMKHLDVFCEYRLFYELKNCAQEFDVAERKTITSFVNQKEQECFTNAADYLAKKKCYHEALGLVEKMYPCEEKERLRELYTFQMETERKNKEKKIKKMEALLNAIK